MDVLPAQKMAEITHRGSPESENVHTLGRLQDVRSEDQVVNLEHLNLYDPSDQSYKRP